MSDIAHRSPRVAGKPRIADVIGDIPENMKTCRAMIPHIGAQPGARLDLCERDRDQRGAVDVPVGRMRAAAAHGR